MYSKSSPECDSFFSPSIPGEKPNKDPYRMKKKYSTKLEDLDYLPLDFCRQHLRVRWNERSKQDLFIAILKLNCSLK